MIVKINITDEEIAKNHEMFLKRNEFYKKFGFDQMQARENILRAIPKPLGKALEIGTGKGYLTKILAREAESVVSLDLNEADQRIAVLNVAQEKLQEKVSFKLADAENLPFANASFDTVVCAFTFHHFEQPYIALEEMIRVCAKKLVITDFNERGFDIVNKAHEQEGRQHDRGKADLAKIENYLREKQLSVFYTKDDWQDIYLAVKS